MRQPYIERPRNAKRRVSLLTRLCVTSQEGGCVYGSRSDLSRGKTFASATHEGSVPPPLFFSFFFLPLFYLLYLSRSRSVFLAHALRLIFARPRPRFRKPRSFGRRSQKTAAASVLSFAYTYVKHAAAVASTWKLSYNGLQCLRGSV